jgi:hypothetical protein
MSENEPGGPADETLWPDAEPAAEAGTAEPPLAGTAEPTVAGAADQPDPPAEPGAPSGTASAEAADSATNRLEDVDPEPDPGDQDAARADRMRGINRIVGISTGEHGRQYQAEQITFIGGEASAVPRTGKIPGSILRRLGESYVEPPCAGILREALDIFPLQCVVGPPGEGRTTMAIVTGVQYLRDRNLPIDGNVLILAADRGLAAVDSDAIPPRSALILTLAPDAVAPDLAIFGAVGAALGKRESILIVVSAAEPAGSAALKDDWVVRYRPPEPFQVFRCHLEQRLAEQRVEEILAITEVRDYAYNCRTPRAAARLAADVISDLENGLADSDLLSGEPTDQLHTASKELEQSELWDRILLVAATVLADLPAGTVIREAMRLAEMHKTSGVLTELPKIEWFHGPDRWSGSIKLSEPTVDGSGRTVRLVHPRLPVPLLEVIWENHVGERAVLLPWLYSLGAHPHKRVRVKAAQAAAQFACYDFDVVMREVLRVWALDGRFRSRETCALALEALAVAAGGRFAKRVRGQVRGWARSNSPALLAAAVAAYGTFLGAKDPDEALARMREVAGARIFRVDGRRDAVEHAEQGLANIVQAALIDVFDAGAQEKVIHALAGWARVPNWRWRRASARGLLQLARRDGSGEWPLLVELSVRQESTYQAVFTLWHNTLDAGHRDEAAWEALHRWLNQARELRGDDRAGSAVAVVDRLVADLRGNDDIRRHLVFHQRIWAFRDAQRSAEDTTPRAIEES